MNARVRRGGEVLMVLGTLAISLVALLAACAPLANDGPREPGGAAGGQRSGEGASPQGGPAKIEGGSVKDEVRTLVRAMSLEDLVGQMFVVAIGGTEPDSYAKRMIRGRNVGGVILFAHNMENEEQTRALVGALQRFALQAEPRVPLFVAVDQEGGEIGSAPWVPPQPTAARIGARGDEDEARAVAEKIGRQLSAAGVNTDLAPVVDTGHGAAIGPRSYGEDPELVGLMGAAAVRGFEAARVVSAAKHFPNHGAAAVDSHVGLPVVDHDLATVRSVDVAPFEAAIEAGVPMVMVGHLLYPAIDPRRPASLSAPAISMLREELGFQGVVITDDLAMAAAAGGEPPARAAVAAAAAGADLLLLSSPPQQQADAIEAVVAAVESGEIPREQVRASVERVLRVKARYPLRG